MSTQVGGKYHPDDDAVFQVKRVLSQLGVSVSHPLANEIKEFRGNRAFAFDSATRSFHDVERHYYECIRTCDFHTVCNQFKENLGYLGSSASLEMAYAMCHGRPVVALHSVTINANVDSQVRSFLAVRLHRVVMHNFLCSTVECNQQILFSLDGECADYGVTDEERRTIESHVQTLFDGLSAEEADATA
jgi:hypothetical protein